MSFLGVEWEAKLPDSVFSVPHDYSGVGGDTRIVYSKRIEKLNIGKGATVPFHLIPEPRLEKMNELLERLDYPRVESDWGTSPSAYESMMATNRDAEESAAASSLRDLFEEYVPRQIRAWKETSEGRDSAKGICKFVVSAEEGGIWVLDLGRATVSGPDPRSEKEASCTIVVNPDDLILIVNERLNVHTAILDGRVRMAGDLMLAEQVAKIFVH